MSYNPHIPAARREAKRRARDTGASYQASLETVARASGAASWAAYMANPVEITPGHGTGHGAGVPVAKPKEPGQSRMNGRRVQIVVGATAALLTATSGTAAVLFTDARHSAAMTTVQQDDSAAAAHVTFKGDTRPALVTALPGGRREVTFIMADFRGLFDTSWWRAWHAALVWTGAARPRGDGVADDPTRTFLTKAYDHQVQRVRLVVDCRTGRYRMTRIELADSYGGKAAASMVAAPGATWRTMPAGEAAGMCGDQALAQGGRAAARG